MAENKTNKELAFEGIKGLVEKFENNYKQFHASDYNETLTRQDFINPFFEYLGWDISNKQGYSQTYREVIHEDKLKINRETKSPDYSFRIGGNRVFFVEAKKPSLNLKEDSSAAYQVKRYAWSGKLAVSILTDFEEFAIYDCTKKPSPNDKASMSRIEYINYKDYLNRFDFLYDTFAKENVLKGSLEKYNAETKNKKGTESVDIDFLNSLDNLRTKLASSISKLNSLSERDLNFAVQHIIDRIIFLRVAEDRGVENYGDLRDACAGENYYNNIVEIFKKADGKYNSGIFDFRKDEITQDIKVENKIIKEIINDLYYPKSPYEFSVISVEIIGNAYEQFLGKTITIGNNHKAKIELKPEVRKAGGVYYTPEYIVDYIVENTVGEKIKNKSPKEISNIKIVDPACGSGSFLLGAYKYLLNYHREYYSKQGKKKFMASARRWRGSKEDAITEDGDLALWVKKQILINNIFGVDIDSNAVEVTKLSLLLKCMEGETPASIMNNQSLFNERALPSLDENIKCGNSLIGNDFYRAGDSLNIDIETQYKINCFDWEKEFPKIFSRKKKEVKAYHITFALHNSRVSERMITYKVSKGEVLNLSEEDELFITKSIGEVILKNDIKCLAYNISRDHVHILLVCEDKELTEIVRKIKGYSSYSFREYLNIPKGEEFHLWAQKYDAKEVGNDDRLYNTIEYINNNRIKHELPENKGLQPLALSFLCGQKGNSNNNVAFASASRREAHCVNNLEKANKGLSQMDIYNSDNNAALAHCMKVADGDNNSYEQNKTYGHKGLSQRDIYNADNNVASAHCVKIADGDNNTIGHKGLSQRDIYNADNNVALAHCVNNLEKANKGLSQRDIYNADNNVALAHCVNNSEKAHKGLKPLVIKFEDAFNEAFNQYENGGFDIVIGNPPYVFVKYVEWAEDIKNYFTDNYNISNKNNKSKANQSGKINLYTLFIFRSNQILKENGYFSFIVPNGLLRTTTYDMARKFILDNYHIDFIADLKDGVFKGVTAPTIIFRFSKSKSNNEDTLIIDANYSADGFIDKNKSHYINQSIFLQNTSYTFSIFLNPKETMLFEKMDKNEYILGDITSEIIAGIVCDTKLILNEMQNHKLCKKLLKGKNIKKYKIEFDNNYLIFDRKKLHRGRPDEVWNSNKKIITQRISGGLHPIVAAIDTEHYYCFGSTNLILIKKEFENIYNYEIICALLNSKLINFYYVKNFTNASNLTVNISKTFLEQIPLPKIDLNNQSDKEIHDKLVNLVDNIIEINKKLNNEKNPDSATMLRRQVQSIDDNIDKIVYGLYGLSEEDIKVVEGVD